MSSTPAPKLRPGRYRHYKGKDYQVIDVARHSETEEALVVYRLLYDDHSLWVRPLAMFTEEIEHNGQRQPRFAYLSET
ncbi:hypothetical protein CMV30_03915 [Nibricoccus aquaticus]|uniref:DUF1653 domain-containing protein n=1 Tax=Nibricoccus aquaticus TaxID=2576891 RepID=A0A290Q7M8_9BACT|nr:DUF1653 domain-containing protein [Nibricoccus aquaticus]ATC63170.1 hypothetical protein CMV30_03915 [Nibricoccus aquaticus]